MVESNLQITKKTEEEERVASSSRAKRWSLTISAPDTFSIKDLLEPAITKGTVGRKAAGVDVYSTHDLYPANSTDLPPGPISTPDLLKLKRDAGRKAAERRLTSKRNVVAVWITKDGKPPMNLYGVEAGLAIHKILRYLGDNSKQARFVNASVRLSCSNFSFEPMFTHTWRAQDSLDKISQYLGPPGGVSNAARPASGVVNQCPVLMVGDDVGVALFEVFYRSSERGQRVNAQVVADAHLFAGVFILAKSLFKFRLSLNFGRIGRSRPAAFYDKIFASYSHKDSEVVQAVASYVNAMGRGKLLWDTRILHAGEDWGKRVKEEIYEADIFQLFWSENARASAHVTEEWKYALGLKRDDFVKPLYWDEPLPQPPRNSRTSISQKSRY
jgi:hypothetical protein